MKKLLPYVSLFGVLLCVGCAKEASDELTPEDESQLETLTFSLSASPRTSLSGMSVLWDADDELSVFDSTGANRNFTTEGSGSSTVFTGKTIDSPEYYVLYPYDSKATIADGKISTTLPSSQNAVAGSFSDGANLSCCILKGCSGQIKNACSYASLTLKSSGLSVSSIKMKSAAGESLSGPVDVEIKEGIPVLTPASDAVSTVTLCPSLAAISDGSYVLTVCPGTMSGGVIFTITTSDGYVYNKKAANAFEFERNVMTDFGTFDLSEMTPFEEEPEDSSADPVSAYASYGIDFKKITDAGHPRLFMYESDFEALKKRVADDANPEDIAYRLHRVIMKQAASIAASSSVLTLDLSSSSHILSTSRDAVRRLFYLAYAYRMTGEEKYLTKARTDLAIACSFEDWNASVHFLDPSEMALAVSVAYDWLYYDLTLAERTAAHAALKNFEMIPFKTYGTATGNNWNQVCNGGALAASIVLYDKEKTLSAYNFDKSIKSNKIAVDYMYNPNGNGIEGNGYWKYAMKYQIVIMAALERIFNTSCGIAETEGLKKTGFWELFMEGPVGGFNFSDSGDFTNAATSEFIWLAARYNLPDLLVLDNDLLTTDSYNSDRCLPLMLSGLQRYSFTLTSSVFPSQRIWWSSDISSIVLTRLGWNFDATDKFFGLKGCGAYNNHSHMDAGSFVYDAFGQRWAWDVPFGDYDGYRKLMSSVFGRSQTATRWDILAANNYFHNTLNFTWSDGSVKKTHVTDHVVGDYGSVLSVTDNADEGYGGKVDISCYFVDAASSVTRDMRILGEELLVIDRIKSKDSHSAPFEWRMVTKAQVRVESDYIALTQNGVTVYLYSKVSGDIAKAPEYGYEEELVRPSSWTARDWDSVQSLSGYHVVKFSAEVAYGSGTGTFTTFISPVKPSENPLYISGEIPGLEDRDEAQW